MANGGLSIAEQYVDRQARTELCRGRQIEVVTGRVVVHALNDHGQPLCGHDTGQLTETVQQSNDGYRPHLLRCQRCTAQVIDAQAPARPEATTVRFARSTAGRGRVIRGPSITWIADSAGNPARASLRCRF